MDHEERMRLAVHITELVLKRLADTVAIGIIGSTAKGEDREHSDLEMSVITTQKPPRHEYYIIDEDIVVGLEIRSVSEAEQAASKATLNWPFTADQWIHVLPTHDPLGIFRRLGELASNPAGQELTESMGFALIWAYHALCKMRNFALAEEIDLLRHMAPTFAASIARFLALFSKKYYNGVRNLITLSLSFEELPPHFREDFLPLIGCSASTPQILPHSERLLAECSALLQTRKKQMPSKKDLQAAITENRQRTSFE